MTTEIANQQRALRVPRKKIVEIVDDVLASREMGDALVSVAVVDNRTIRSLNRQFLNSDRVTDVIAFPLDHGPASSDAPLLGEVVVSAERAKQVARRRGGTPTAELLLYVVHGLLHLLGMTDDSPGRGARMHSEALDILTRHKVRGVT